MLKRFVLASALATLAAPALLLAAEPTPAPTPEPSIVLKAARLFDGTSDKLVTPRRRRGDRRQDRRRRQRRCRTGWCARRRPRRRHAAARVHRRPHPPDRRGVGELVPRLLRTASCSCRRSRRCSPSLTPNGRSRPASPPSATSAPTTTSTSACATPSPPASCRGRACSSRRTPSVPPAAMATARPRTPTVIAPLRPDRGHLQRPRRVPRRGALPDQVRRRRHQGHALGRRALALRSGGQRRS